MSNDNVTSTGAPPARRNLWRWAWGLVTGGVGLAFVVGIVFWGGFNTAM